MAKTNQEKEVSVSAVEVLEELTETESRERHRLELRVDRIKQAFYDAGVALRQLREQKLYKSTHNSFEDYCIVRFDFSRDKADLMIKAVEVVDNLKSDDNCRRFLPTAESQVRDLANFTAAEQCQIYTTAIDEAGDKVPPRRIVKSIAERLKQKSLVLAADFCQVADVFTLTKLDGAERKYNGCWAIASDTHGITVGVDVHDGSLRVKPENLKRIDSPEIHRSLPAIHSRIKRLRKCGKLDRSAEVLLSHFGKQTYLTDFEDKLLTFMEQQHGIKEHF